MSERDSTLDPASRRRRDDEEIFDDDRELERARRLVKRNEAYLKQIREHRDKANDSNDGRNQSNDVQTVSRGRGNNSQQSREAGTHRTVGNMEYRRAQKTLHKSREILKRMRGEKDEDGEQNNDDPQEEETERNSEFSSYSNRTYNSDVLKKLYPSRESRKSRRERPFSRNDDLPERDNRDQRGASHRRRENGSGGRGLPAGYFDRFRRDVPTDPAAAEQPRRPAADPSAADVEPPAGRSEPALMPGRREARPPVVIPEMEHPELIDWDYFKFRCVDMMNRQGPHFLKIEEISLSAVSNRDIENVRAYGIALKRAIDELLNVFMDCLKGDAPGLRKTLLKDFERFLKQYTFNGYNTFESYPGGRWMFLTKEEFDRIKDIIRPPPPPPRSSGNDGAPSGGAGAVPDDSDRHRSGRNDGGVGPAAARRLYDPVEAGRKFAEARQREAERRQFFDERGSQMIDKFKEDIRKGTERTGPAPGPPAADGKGRSDPGDVNYYEAFGPAPRYALPDMLPIEEGQASERVPPPESAQESGSREEEGAGNVVPPRARLVPPSDGIDVDKASGPGREYQADPGSSQGYASLPDERAPRKAQSSGWFRRVIDNIRKNRETRYAGRVKNMDELEGKRRPWVWRRGTRSRVEARLRSMGHPYYQAEELN